MPIPSSRRSEAPFAAACASALLASALLASCAARPIRTVDALPAAPSVAIPVDPISSIPTATDKAVAGEGVVTLRTPIGTEQVTALVHRLFEAFHARSLAPIDSDFDDVVVDLASGDAGRPRAQFLAMLQDRMKSPFDQLDLDQMYRPQDVEIWARDDLGLPGRPVRPNAMGADDVLVRIPIATPRVGADVLFGDEIRLLLRRDGSTYRIRGYFEVGPR